MARYPFGIPNGWFMVGYSDELAPREVRPLHRLGRELVLWRGEDGAAHVNDAYCPHLGAHLGHGGQVEGDSLRCPFHAWRFDGSGACVEIPYAKRIPPRAQLGCWPVAERNGMILVWKHDEGKAPFYEIPQIPEHGSDEWTPYEKRHWTIKAHTQEMGENLADVAHFRFVHGTLTIAEGAWEADGAYLHMENHAKMRTPQGDVDGLIDVHCWGPGYGVIRFGGIIDTLLVESTTPIDGETTDVNFAFSVRRLGSVDATRGVGAALIADIEKQMREDTPIWENKRFLTRPMLCDGDGPIARYRKWCEQFYEGVPAPSDG